MNISYFKKETKLIIAQDCKTITIYNLKFEHITGRKIVKEAKEIFNNLSENQHLIFFGMSNFFSFRKGFQSINMPRKKIFRIILKIKHKRNFLNKILLIFKRIKYDITKL